MSEQCSIMECVRIHDESTICGLVGHRDDWQIGLLSFLAGVLTRRGDGTPCGLTVVLDIHDEQY